MTPSPCQSVMNVRLSPRRTFRLIQSESVATVHCACLNGDAADASARQPIATPGDQRVAVVELANLPVRFTAKFKLSVPIVQAPMGGVAAHVR